MEPDIPEVIAESTLNKTHKLLHKHIGSILYKFMFSVTNQIYSLLANYDLPDHLRGELTFLTEEYARLIFAKNPLKTQALQEISVQSTLIQLLETLEINKQHRHKMLSFLYHGDRSVSKKLADFTTYIIDAHFWDFNRRLNIFIQKTQIYQREQKNKKRVKYKKPDILMRNTIIWDEQNIVEYNSESTKAYQKLSKVHDRLDNIISGKWTLWKKELISIDEQLINVAKYSGCSDLLEVVKAKITQIQENKIPKKPVQTTLLVNKYPILTTDSVTEKDIFPNRDKYIYYIDSLLEILTHRLSSTKNNSNSLNTFWDGSFLKKIFRPFLYRFKNVLLPIVTLDIENTSWNDIIDLYTKNIVDQDQAMFHFIGILKKRETVWDFNFLYNELIGVIEEFSQTSFYAETSTKDPLLNVIATLKQNPPNM